jgi:hypothetical protein
MPISITTPTMRQELYRQARASLHVFFCTIAHSFLHIMTHSRTTLYCGSPVIVDRSKMQRDACATNTSRHVLPRRGLARYAATDRDIQRRGATGSVTRHHVLYSMPALKEQGGNTKCLRIADLCTGELTAPICHRAASRIKTSISQNYLVHV